MSDGTSIEWTDATWNPVRGCTKISPGCKHCYAETFAERFRGVSGHPFEHGFDLQLVPNALALPLKWRASRRVFVNSMSDLFHEDVPDAYIRRVFDVMRQADHHEFQVLTKRSDRMAKFSEDMRIPDNVWMGVSVENDAYLHRVDDLRHVDAAIRFLSIEPLIGPLPQFNLSAISWVIVGGESGPRARPMNADWVRTIRDHCRKNRVPFFFKQWGGVRKKLAGRLLDGRTWDEMPRNLRAGPRLLAVVNG
jgi:protein gp37